MTTHLLQSTRRLAAGLLLGALAAMPALAADGQLGVLVPWPAGGPVDTSVRALQQEIGKAARASVVVENVPGAGGLIGLERYFRKPVAERGMLAGSNSDMVASLLTASTGNGAKMKPEDFRLLAITGEGGFGLMVRNGFPARTFDELVAHARSQPAGALKFAHTGAGTLFHLAWEELSARANITALQVPYKGVPDILRDLGGGNLDAAFVPLNTTTANFPGVRVIGMTGPVRNPHFPHLPTIAEGRAVPGFQYTGWFALAALRDTPAPELERLERWAQAAVQSAAYAETSRTLGHTVPAPMTRAQLDQFYEAEIARHRQLVARLGLGS